MKLVLIEDFTSPSFQQAYKQYCEDMGERVRDWERCFERMNSDPHGKNYAYLLTEGQRASGFIQFTVLDAESWFFRSRLGFVRELWVDAAMRGKGLGSRLLEQAEAWFEERSLPASILTTNTAEAFYTRHGYIKTKGIHSENGDAVFTKALSQNR